MNIEIIYVIGGSTLATIGCMISLFLWLRSEANSDRKHYDNLQTQDRRDFISIMNEIKLENRDFHHRLLEIERTRKS